MYSFQQYTYNARILPTGLCVFILAHIKPYWDLGYPKLAIRSLNDFCTHSFGLRLTRRFPQFNLIAFDIENVNELSVIIGFDVIQHGDPLLL
jgi:hypothetical protein